MYQFLVHYCLFSQRLNCQMIVIDFFLTVILKEMSENLYLYPKLFVHCNMYSGLLQIPFLFFFCNSFTVIFNSCYSGKFLLKICYLLKWKHCLR